MTLGLFKYFWGKRNAVLSTDAVHLIGLHTVSATQKTIGRSVAAYNRTTQNWPSLKLLGRKASTFHRTISQGKKEKNTAIFH